MQKYLNQTPSMMSQASDTRGMKPQANFKVRQFDKNQ